MTTATVYVALGTPIIDGNQAGFDNYVCAWLSVGGQTRWMFDHGLSIDLTASGIEKLIDEELKGIAELIDEELMSSARDRTSMQRETVNGCPEGVAGTNMRYNPLPEETFAKLNFYLAGRKDE